MIAINIKSATYAYTSTKYNSERGMAVAFTRDGDADAAKASGAYETSTLSWASGHANVYVRNDGSLPISYHCWYITDEEEEETKVEFTGTIAAGEEKQITNSKPSLVGYMYGIFSVVNIVTVYGAQLS